MNIPRTLALAAVGLLAAASAHGLAQKPKDDAPPLPKESELMAAKLKRAQAMMEALAKDDHKALAESATALGQISKAAWFLRAYKTDEYDFQARAFQKAADVMVEKANARNLDGVTLAFHDLTRTCVACHSHIRSRKRD